jgi:hypothetical protein
MHPTPRKTWHGPTRCRARSAKFAWRVEAGEDTRGGEHGKGRAHTVKLHRQCCLFHLLPREGYCGACPLSPAHR